MNRRAVSSGDILLSVKDLSYGTPLGRPLIHHLSFDLQKGKIGLISGPNGQGKSTLLKIILGAHKPTSGTAVTRVSPRHISYLPQMQNKSFHIPLLLREVIDFARPNRHVAEFEDDLSHLCLLSPTQRNISWNEASGGERQKALLSMALMSQSPLILLDEPLNHLDLEGKERFTKALAYASHIRQKTLLMVSHESELLDGLGDSLIPVPLQTFAVRGHE